MAPETRPPGDSASARAAREGAAPSAPTAPHAGDAAESQAPTGPSRFWASPRARLAFAGALLASLAIHYIFSPFALLPDSGGITFKDVDDELTIPVELMAVEAPAEPPPKPPEPPPPTSTPAAEPTAGKSFRDAAPPERPDASRLAALDAGARDAAPHDADAADDAEVAEAGAEGGAPAGDGDAGDAGATDGGAVAVGPSGVRDGGAPKVGFAGLVTAGPTNVRLLLNVALIRQHPVGAKMGPLLNGIPQWADFMKGTQTLVDPVRDTDWILIYGPSLIHTERDAIFVHYGLPDAVVDRAIAEVTKKYAKGGPYDAGVPGVAASLGHADQAERVFLRAQPHEAAVVPPSKAHDFVALLRQRSVDPGLRPGEALRLIVRDPYRQVAVPGLKFPDAMTELRLWVVPRADGGAEVYADGECKGEAEAADVAERTREMISRQNASVLVKIATRGILNNVDIRVSGNVVKTHLSASREQTEGILQVVAAQMGVQLPAPGAPTPAPVAPGGGAPGPAPRPPPSPPTPR